MYSTVNETKRAYTYYLEQKMKQIWGMWQNKKVSLETMKKNIFNYIFDAASYYIDTAGNKVPMKKQEFLKNVEAMVSKEDVYWYCYNSVNKAKRTPLMTR